MYIPENRQKKAKFKVIMHKTKVKPESTPYYVLGLLATTSLPLTPSLHTPLRHTPYPSQHPRKTEGEVLRQAHWGAHTITHNHHNNRPTSPTPKVPPPWQPTHVYIHALYPPIYLSCLLPRPNSALGRYEIGPMGCIYYSHGRESSISRKTKTNKYPLLGNPLT